MQTPNAYQMPQFYIPAEFQPGYQYYNGRFSSFSLNFPQNFPQMGPVMYRDINSSQSICHQNETKVKKEIFSSPKSVSSLEALTECPSLSFDMLSTSPSLTNTTEETFYGSAQDYFVKEGRKPFKILRQSKKINKEESDQTLPNTRLNNNRSRKNGWKAEEDAQLCQLVAELGPQWTKIGSILGKKTGKQVRDRYMNTSRPDINYTEWTEEEDNLFLSLLGKHGKKWCQIASEMPGRTENQVKNKFYCLRRDRKKNNQRRNALREAINGVKSDDTNSSPETQSQEHNPVYDFADVDEFFGFNQSNEWNDEVCFENNQHQTGYIPLSFVDTSYNNVDCFFN